MFNPRNILTIINTPRLLWPLKIAVTVFVIYLADRGLSKTQLGPLIGHMSFMPTALAILLGCACFYFQVIRWRIILRGAGIPVTGKTALRTMLWGSLLAFITPGRTGELFRATGLPATKKSQTVYAVLIDKMFAGGSVVAVGALCCMVMLFGKRPSCWGFWIIIIGATLAAAGAGLAFRLRNFSPLKKAFRQLPTLKGRSLGNVIACSIAAHALLLVQTAALFDMFGSRDFQANILAAGQSYAFMLFFPFFIANMGIREYAFGMFLGGALVPAAFGASMGILAINIVLPALLGLGWWMVDIKKISGAPPR
jgi:hypothetical protein